MALKYVADISFSSAVIVCLFVCVLFKYSINVFFWFKIVVKNYQGLLTVIFALLWKIRCFR